jgi:acyl-homoserine lactone acylase PvdQ
MNHAMRIGILFLYVGISAAACTSDNGPGQPAPVDAGGKEGGSGDAAPGDAADAGASPVDAVPISETVSASSLSAPVDIVRDEWGNPHIYGQTLADVSYAQGYIVARDRFVQMDLARHQASGTIAELAGMLSPSTLDGDVAIRAHHLRKTASDGFAALKASSDPKDQAIVAAFGSFAKGVNAYLADFKAGKFPAPADVAFVDDFALADPWTEIDSLALGELQAFNLAFDAASEISMSLLDAKAAAMFGAGDPRAGLGTDMQILAPFDPTYTIDGWTMSKASAAPRAREARPMGA